MTDQKKTGVTLTYQLEASPEKIWKALRNPEFRRQWWPDGDHAEEIDTAIPGQSVSYRLKESEPPFLESVVTFEVEPYEGQVTTLKITHELVGAIVMQLSDSVANDNGATLMQAA